MSCTIEFFYDFRSPYSYLAFTQLRALDASIDFKPMKVLTVMEKVGNTPTTITCAAKGRYARTDLGRWARRYGIALNPSDMRTNDGEAMARAVIVTAAEQRADVTLTLFRAIWSEGRSLATSEAVVAELAAAGIDTAIIAAQIDTEETAAQLDSFTDEAAMRGVFGSPTMILDDAMFFGNDRIDFLREEIARLEVAA
ncbi:MULTISPECIES: 2-hydroxychromene-2-carboxylate isomerase [Rhizobium/Agrobacterium group]|uniref:2-hydroxychromene-2-carboxylate isomerase n=2 Tax=Rhizobium/Agrobacterium group TaxID=227290 RepID=A0A9X3KQY8_9HYPH|nr:MULTISPECIES: 2-hydroxychromene-2-carboxylate isomerase [Rhizobium/Agrobacterium group]MBO9126259.1 2-hydroxychromene-2-carboxylate isomerase [Rhizobium sp. 16-488-2b]MBO9176843.1 2-hydroxychromene-2-carboxylate isomerase [Rhizobium sp. 16-488-2a]MBO9197412.1 2-hydroxychromene-2-carboxylate isomerase [Rhizobium sp. 16-449-1b]MCZ7466722.1 2-hydroxychromene-2-carboxylate isomerase [Rhizobium rhizogenes]MCZ7939244.1 2-hydroxychromene-2-carboxylate isomerase [Agrobacterium salinitolerans]